MIDFIEYVVKELKSKRLSKANALSLVEEFTNNKGSSASTSIIHPLLHKNTSDLNEQKYSSTFDGNEFFLNDHQVTIVQESNDKNTKQKILPGVAYLEMALAAIEDALPDEEKMGVIELRNIIWAFPIIVKDKKQVDIALLVDGEKAVEQIDYEIFSEREGQDIIHCQGQAIYVPESDSEICDILKLKNQMNPKSLPASDFYSAFANMGLHYGPAHRGIEEVFKGKNQLLALVKLPDVVQGEKASYQLNPSILDSALQSTLGLVEDLHDGTYQASVPFALESLRLFNRLNDRMYVWVRYSDDSSVQDNVTKLDIDLFDQSGVVCVQLRGFSTRELTPPAEVKKINENKTNSLVATYQWNEEKNFATVPNEIQASYQTHILISTSISVLPEEILQKLWPVSGSSLNNNSQSLVKSFQDAALTVFRKLKIVIEEKSKQNNFFQIVIADEQGDSLLLGLTGLLKTAALENSSFTGQIIVVNSSVSVDRLCTILEAEKVQSMDGIVRYDGAQRSVLRWTEERSKSLESDLSDVAFKEGGVYLITGGLGGVGQIFTQYILQQTKRARVFITGRGELDSAKQELLDTLSTKKGRVSYCQLDLYDLHQVEKLISTIDSDFSGLNGILHCAGYNVDNFILNKSEQEFLEVLAPKVMGSVNLDQACREIDLDFLVLFSSSVAVFGNLGQADYAAANGFMDQFSSYRNSLQKSGERFGKTVSINWSLWQEGGMQVQDDALEILRYSTGLCPMKSETGISLFSHCLALPEDQFLVAEGDIEQFKAALLDNREQTIADTPLEGKQEKTADLAQISNNTDSLNMANARLDTPDSNTILEDTQNYLKSEFSLLVKISPSKINPASPLEEYGINSILAMNFTSQLEKTFGNLSKTLLFEYQSIRDLSLYFIQSHKDTLNSLFEPGIEERTIVAGASEVKAINSNQPDEPSPSLAKPRRVRRQRFSANQQFTSDLISSVKSEKRSQIEQSIAIVGLSGRYPQAINIDEYWQNLQKGKNCIEEVPKDRWQWQDYYSDDRLEEGRHYSKWGGFIKGVDEFDPRFFNISPREAFYIDPQERLFLQHSWMAIEDAGYTRASLQLPREGLNAQVGVYTGVMYGEYNLSGSLASIANRVSYFLNLHGPSMTLDTMCSSSLTAIHLACQDLKYGVTDLGIAGGVNVSISPSKYMILSAGQFISSNGVCQSFGEGGDGYIPGEGVGVVVLKRLSEAKRDGNLIYAVIKGSSLNHGGKTNGYTVPNPQAQAAVISEALDQAKIDPQRISYIEAHGTGTQLGDPIEIAALSKAFTNGGTNQKREFGSCLIGSAKSNIGHCESAAGIAGLTKILLQMKYKKIVPSLHSETLNPHIDFDKTPFLVNQELTDWKTPEIDGQALPRIAGLSSFGAGGSNAHIVVQEYIQPQLELKPSISVAIILSARTQSQLKQKATELLEYVQTTNDVVDLESIAYTLQVGREAMTERLALVVNSSQQLIEMLSDYSESNDRRSLNDIFEGQSGNDQNPFAFVDNDDDFQETIEKWFVQKKLSKLASLWVKGVELAWQRLYSARSVTTLSLPSYPFANEKYWTDTLTTGPLAILKSSDSAVDTKSLHPLLHTNISDFYKQSYQSIFSGNESFFTEQSLGNMEQPNHDSLVPKCLSSFAYLEMVREAIVRSIPSAQEFSAFRLTNVVWGAPFSAQMKVPLQVELYFDDNGNSVDFDVYSSHLKDMVIDASMENSDLVHCQGTAELTNDARANKIDISQVKIDLKRFEDATYISENLKHCFQVKNQLFAEINRANKVSTTADSKPQKPSFFTDSNLLEGLNEALGQFVSRSNVRLGQEYIESSIAAMEFYRPLEQSASVWIQIVDSENLTNTNEYTHLSIDLVLFNQHGEVFAQIIGLQLAGTSESGGLLMNPPTTTINIARIDSTLLQPVFDKPDSINLTLNQSVNQFSDTQQNIAKPKGIQLLETPITSIPSSSLSKSYSSLRQEPKIARTEQSLDTDIINRTQQESKKSIALLRSELKQSLADALYLTIDEIDARRPFIDLGLDSIVGVEWVNSINKQYGLKISATRVYDYSNVIELSLYLEKEIDLANDMSQSTMTRKLSLKEEHVVNSKTIDFDFNKPVADEIGFSLEQLKQRLKSSLADALYMEVEEIEEEKSFIDLGLDSIVGVEWVNSINKQLALSISATRVYDYSNINQLSEYIRSELLKLPHHDKNAKASQGEINKTEPHPKSSQQPVIKLPQISRLTNQNVGQITVNIPLLKRHNRSKKSKLFTTPSQPVPPSNVEQPREKIAIIGMSGRYPEAIDLNDYWTNLVQGKNSVVEIPSSRWDVNQYFDPDPTKEGKIYSKWLGKLDDIECFDPLFFQISPAEAESMDPQHRIFMQEAYKAFEDAGYANESLSNRKCGVYLGIMSSDYSQLLAKDTSGNVDTTANSFAIGAARIAYYLNLKGPAIPIDTACSSSLVTIHLASQALLNGEIDMALAGGVSLYLTSDSYLGMCQAGMLSPDGQCKTFDNSANGFVPGEGVGAVVLKRLSDAENDHDSIHGVILGSAINQDGKTNGITAPSVNSQIELERELYNKFNIDPETISYVETHGTGTKLGDPIELEALGTVFSEKTSKKNYCALGSVKSNIGHTSGAAGVASVHKVLLSMRNRTIVPSLHVENENSLFDFADSPFYIAKKKHEWGVAQGTRRRAAVSSFGFSGTNAHLIVEEYESSDGVQNESLARKFNQTAIVPLSARTEQQLEQKVSELFGYCQQQPDLTGTPNTLSLMDLSFTLQIGRAAMKHRLAFVVNSIAQLEEQLADFLIPSSDSKRDDRNLLQGHVSHISEDEKDKQDIDRLIERKQFVQLAKIWVSGFDIDWNKLYQESKPKRISLPTYPFSKQKYWLDIKSDVPVSEPQSMTTLSNKIPQEENQKILFIPEWKPMQIPKAELKVKKNELILVLGTEEEFYRLAKMTLSENLVVWLNTGAASSQSNADEPILDFAGEKNLDKFLKSLDLHQKTGLTVIHHDIGEKTYSNISLDRQSEMVDHQVKRGVLALLTLCQTLMKQKIQKPVKILSICSARDLVSDSMNSGLVGFFKSLMLENSKYVAKQISVYDGQPSSISKLHSIALDELTDTSWEDAEVRYLTPQNGNSNKRFVKKYFERPSPFKDREIINIKQRGSYILSGGLGGLGYLFSEHLVVNYHANLILFGRSELTPENRQRLEMLRQGKSEVIYIQADVEKIEDVKHVLQTAKKHFKQINGIIHSAGINRDTFIFNKTVDEFKSVVSPKIKGTVNLDSASRNEDLDWFIMFSSVSGAFGNLGQSDYAFANHFMDAFAEARTSKRDIEQRGGQTLSINWPLWQTGGMKLSQDDIDMVELKTGMVPMPSQQGFLFWQQLLSGSDIQALTLYGKSSKLRNYVLADTVASQPGKKIDDSISASLKYISEEDLVIRTEAYIKGLISNEIKLEPELIDSQERLEIYGIDSIIIGRFNINLNRDLGELPKTLLYEYETIEELTNYLVTEEKTALLNYFCQTEMLAGELLHRPNIDDSIISEKTTQITVSQAVNSDNSTIQETLDEQIAIVGVHGYYPQSNDIESFWEKLKRGDDLIGLVPQERWDYEEFYDADPQTAADGKIYCKWGGFLDHFDKFDPEFFNITLQEAKIIDPQERLFIQSVWATIEDAGYTRDSLKRYFPKDKSSSVGVFVGVTTNTYHLLAPEEWNKGNMVTPSALPWSIANRISYYFDFNGPSMPVDTACSSSLVAIHLACESIKKQECKVAIAGGVNLYLHPSKYQSLCSRQMLAVHGKNCSFGAGDDGFIPGEGVGSLLLKPLREAISHNDHIYAVIKGSSFNHSGRSNGYSAPNPNSQANLVEQTLTNAGVAPETISYVEGHGTGTLLGDSLEILGLTKAFRRKTNEKQYCSIGSVKANIGHSESAAGIAGITKILMQLKHRKIAPSIHCDEINPNIDFRDTPFYPVRELKDWHSPQGVPRRALINSLGAGGVNACVILEEFTASEKQTIPNRWEQQQLGYLIPVSARTEIELEKSVEQLVVFLEKNNSVNLKDLAYTLQVGRESFNKRLVLISSNLYELKKLLIEWLAKPSQTDLDSSNVYTGTLVKREKLSRVKQKQLHEKFVNLISEKNLIGIANLWTSGTNVDWQRLYTSESPERISLPTYPFSQKRHWINDSSVADIRMAKTERVERLHPLLSYNSSTLRAVSFTTELSEKEFYAVDHQVNNEAIFPGAGFLEIAFIAGNIAAERKVRKITDLVWAYPLSFKDGPKVSQIFLKSIGEGTEFEITSVNDECERIVHSEGRLFLEQGNIPSPVKEIVPVQDLIKQSTTHLDSVSFYDKFKQNGFNYGSSFQTVKEFYTDNTIAVSKLELAQGLAKGFEQYILHPTIIDGALQTVAGLMDSVDTATQYLPFALDKVELVRPLSQECYAVVEFGDIDSAVQAGIRKFNIQIVNKNGDCLVQMTNFYVRAMLNQQPDRHINIEGYDLVEQ